MKNFLIIFVLLTNLLGHSQQATFKGQIFEIYEGSKDALPFVNISVLNTANGTSSDDDGNFELTLPTGNHKIEFSFVGYITQVIDVEVLDSTTIIKEIILESDSLDIIEIVTETKTQETESALLGQQKQEITTVVAVGSEEISKRGDSDVTAVVTKASGISKQEGSSSIYVRGLGDRYNVTTLNGLPIPSNNPSNKNIDLGIFSTDIVGKIAISKNFDASNSGDFGGASVDIVSKEHTGEPYLKISLSSNSNTNALSEDKFYLQSGPSKNGFKVIDYPTNPLTGYNFNTSWSLENQPSVIGGGISLQGGKKFNIGNQGTLSLFATVGHDNDYNYKEGISRTVDAQGNFLKDFRSNSYTYNTNTTALANAVYKPNNNHKFTYNYSFINSTNQNNKIFNGSLRDTPSEGVGGSTIRRSNYDRTYLIVNQILGTHNVKDNIEFNWALGYNFVENSVPDRMVNSLNPIDENNLDDIILFNQGAISDNHRLIQELDDEEYSANISGSLKFNKQTDNEVETYKGKLILGYSGRLKEQEFESTQFNFDINRNLINTNPDVLRVDLNSLDLFFNQQNFDAEYFSIKTFRTGDNDNPLQPSQYFGDQIIHSGYGKLQYKFSEKLSAQAGLRSDMIFQEILWDTNLSDGFNDLETLEILPALDVKYKLNDEQNIKLAASKTYTLPQFREKAEFNFEDITIIENGNSALDLSNNYNLDLKWEIFPNRGELISLTGLYKLIDNPIVRITQASSTNDISYYNANEASVFGAELELKKNLFEFESDDLETRKELSISGNISYYDTNLFVDTEKIFADTGESVNPTNENNKLTGASDVLFNSSLSYLKQWNDNKNIRFTLNGSYFTDKIYSIGSNNKGNLVDKGFESLDLIVKAKLSDKFSSGISLRNLTNPEVSRIQENTSGDVVVDSYNKGYNFKLSLSYQF